MSDAATADTTATTTATGGDAATGTTQATASTGATATTTTGNEPQDAGAKTDGANGEQGKEGEQAAETYEYQMPEGMALDKSAADALTAFAKEQGIKPAEAQKLAAIGAQMVQRQQEAHAQTVSTWIEQVKTDKEIGGDKFDASLATSRVAMETFGTPELKDVLNATGLGNHPAIVKFFYQVGKRVSQDEHVSGKGGPSGEKDVAKIMFPTMA